MKPTLIIQNCPAESPGTILAYHRDQGRPYLVVHTYRSEPLPDISRVGEIINLGCPHSASRYREIDFLANLFNYVKEASQHDRPYLGICFGGQILATALGAAVIANPVKEIGSYEARLTDEGRGSRLFKGFETTFPVFEWHADTFEVPNGARLLVEGDSCRNQAFAFGNMYALQFHLEADPDDVTKWCAAHPGELAETGKTREEIVSDFRRWAARSREQNFRLLDNFFGA